ncbi:MAG: hypothetical protein JKY65_32500 [Planctomycetes bacterium]|nr:hypothetical protein [Planctomycetota bacterium]
MLSTKALNGSKKGEFAREDLDLFQVELPGGDLPQRAGELADREALGLERDALADLEAALEGELPFAHEETLGGEGTLRYLRISLRWLVLGGLPNPSLLPQR